MLLRGDLWWTREGARSTEEKVQIVSRPTGGAVAAVFADTDDMSLLLRRWRHKLSPAARRGREAAQEHTAWLAQQRTSTRGRQVTAGAEKR